MKCSRCKKVIPATVRFCAYCGERAAQVDTPIPRQYVMALPQSQVQRVYPIAGNMAWDGSVPPCFACNGTWRLW